jgi:threonine/homoserine efflux transporter RhtA
VTDLWAFLTDPANQATLGWLGGGLATVTGALWTAFVWFRSRPSQAPAARGEPPRAAAGIGVAAAGDVHVGRDLVVNDRRWSPAALALLALGVAALAAAVLVGGDRSVGTGVLNDGTIQNSPITIQQGQ